MATQPYAWIDWYVSELRRRDVPVPWLNQRFVPPKVRIERMQKEIERELKVITVAEVFMTRLTSHPGPRFQRLDDGNKRNQGKTKFHKHEREYEHLKQTLHQLQSRYKESKRTLQREFKCPELQELKRKLKVLHVCPLPPLIGKLAQKLRICRCELVGKVQDLNHQLKEIEPRRQEILLRIAYFSSLLVCLLVLYAVHVEDAHQGGIRNLLLDGWWLEFWEIVLLAAGDVESNPGPRQITDEQLAEVSDTPIGEDDCFEVFTSVSTLRAKWHDFCLALGLLPPCFHPSRRTTLATQTAAYMRGLSAGYSRATTSISMVSPPGGGWWKLWITLLVETPTHWP